MPLPELTILSGVGCPPRRPSKKIMKKLSMFKPKARKTKSKRKKVRRSGSLLGNLGIYESRKGRCRGVNMALQNSVGRGKCKTVGRRTVCRSNAGRAFIKKDVAGRLHYENGHYHPMSGMSGIFGNIGGLNGMAKRKRKKSKGRKLASSLRVAKGKCKRTGKTRRARKVCRTKAGKGYIRRDKMGRSHTSTGRFSLNGIGGMGGFGSGLSRIGSGSMGMAHRFGSKKRRSVRRKTGTRRSRGYLSGLSSSLGLPDISKAMPINKSSLIRTAKIAGGAILPITIQNLVVPKSWRFGVKGLLSYAAVGGGLIMGTNRFAKSSAADVGTGVVLGLVFQVVQNYIFKKPLIPVMPTKPVAAPLSGLGDISDLGCASCANAGDCGDIGDCVGYADEDLEDDLIIGDDLDDDDDLDGLYGDDDEDDDDDEMPRRRPRPRPRRRPRRSSGRSSRRRLRYPRNASVSGLDDYLMMDYDEDEDY